MAASAARKIDDYAPQRRDRGAAALRVVDGSKRSSGASKPTAAKKPAGRKPATAGRTKAAPAKKTSRAKSGAGTKARTPKTEAVRGSASRAKAAPRRGAACTRPRPAAYAADGLIQRATAAVLPSRCVESPLTITCRSMFRVFMVVLLAASAFGMVRVTLSAQAAETLAASQKVEKELRAAQLASDDLEISRVALAEPSRIESIAATTMHMTRPANVHYIALPANLPPAAKPTAATPAAGQGSLLPESLKGVFGAAAQITAREAQVLLASGSGLGGVR